MRIMAVVAILAGILELGCAENAKGAKHPVRQRAPFDLHCDADFLEFERLDEKTIGVSGCGKRATYVQLCHDRVETYGSWIATDEECQWVMNSRGDGD